LAIFHAASHALTSRSGRFVSRLFAHSAAALGKPSAHQGASSSLIEPIRNTAIKAVASILAIRAAASAKHFPLRPTARSGLCEAQRTDLKAAQDGKITWAQYFALWGPGG